jgi:hypothetical protein
VLKGKLNKKSLRILLNMTDSWHIWFDIMGASKRCAVEAAESGQ